MLLLQIIIRILRLLNINVTNTKKNIETSEHKCCRKILRILWSKKGKKY